MLFNRAVSSVRIWLRRRANLRSFLVSMRTKCRIYNHNWNYSNRWVFFSSISSSKLAFPWDVSTVMNVVRLWVIRRVTGARSHLDIPPRWTNCDPNWGQAIRFCLDDSYSPDQLFDFYWQNLQNQESHSNSLAAKHNAEMQQLQTEFAAAKQVPIIIIISCSSLRMDASEPLLLYYCNSRNCSAQIVNGVRS